MISNIEVEKQIRKKYEALCPYLNEQSRRIWAAIEAKNYGHGGISIVYRATGITDKTIKKGLQELEKGYTESVRLRKTGGGRKKLTDREPLLTADLEYLLNSTTRGDPESPLLWVCKSTYQLAKELQEKGHKVCQRSICNILCKMGYSLQANRKTQEGKSHRDRNEQFEYINEKISCFQRKNQPIISVDTKKKENIGNFKAKGQEYHPKGQAQEVNVYDFPDKEKGKAIPYGIYDLTKNNGWVNVGISSDTAEFAVESIRSWWYQMGKAVYQNATELYITADCGGSNGYRVKLWKKELQKLANEINMVIHISHFPPGTSKWNKIEHRMFSFISKNWRGRPLVDRATVINLISHTTTQTGLLIKARIDENIYETGKKVPKKELLSLNLKSDSFHGEWNYKIAPKLS